MNPPKINGSFHANFLTDSEGHSMSSWFIKPNDLGSVSNESSRGGLQVIVRAVGKKVTRFETQTVNMALKRTDFSFALSVDFLRIVITSVLLISIVCIKNSVKSSIVLALQSLFPIRGHVSHLTVLVGPLFKAS